MYKVLTLLSLLIPAAAAANPKTVHVVGDCADKAATVQSLFAQEPAQPEIIYLICAEPEWNRLRRIFDKDASVKAFTILKSKTTVLSPAALNDFELLKKAVTHESKHVACGCMLGEK